MKKSEYITIRTTSEIKSFIEKEAILQDRTISYIVNKILEEYIKNPHPKG